MSIWRFVLTACVVLASGAARADLVESFSSDPLGPGSPWSFGIGSNANSQFQYDSVSKVLNVHLNSSLPTARFDRPLGQTLTDTSSFSLAARFSMQITSAPGDQFMQIAFGLTNQSLTGGDRTGSAGNFTSDNVFHTFEFTYFPNVSQFGGPALSPAIFGAQVNSDDAFSNFASLFAGDSDLGDNAVGIKSLPQDTTLEAHLVYNGSTKTATLSMFQVVGNALVAINTETPPLVISAPFSGYDTTHPFSLDTLSIMAYHDGFTTPTAPSLVADVAFQSLAVIVPEPSSLLLAALGGIWLLYRRRRAISFRAY